MNILFFTENYPPETNAAATRVHERAVYWAKWGHNVTVITCQPNFPHGRVFDGYKNTFNTETMDGIRIVRVKTFIASNRGIIRRILDFLSFMVMGYLAARDEPRPDIVISTSPQFFAAVAAWWFAKQRKIRYVFELGDLWPASIAAVGAMRPNIGLRLIEKLELRMYRDADAIIALTTSFKQNLISRGISAEKIAVVINGVDQWRYGPRPADTDLLAELGLSTRPMTIGYVGTHGMAHDLANVLRAAALLRENQNIRFLFVGAGAERDALIAKATQEGLSNVVFAPPQPKERMPAVWSICDVALVHLKDTPVFAGVIPSKIFEAMGMGLPILYVGPEGEGSRIVGSAEAGPIVPPGTPDALANAVQYLADNASRRDAFAKNSLAAAPTYSRETQARHMIAVIQNVIDGKGSHAAIAPCSAETAP